MVEVVVSRATGHALAWECGTAASNRTDPLLSGVDEHPVRSSCLMRIAVNPSLRMRHRKRLWTAFVVLAVFMLVEGAAAFWTGSLALLSDAGHMFTDMQGIGMALAARGRRRPTRLTRGDRRGHHHRHHRVAVRRPRRSGRGGPFILPRTW